MIQISIIRYEGLLEDPQYCFKLDNSILIQNFNELESFYLVKHSGILRVSCKLNDMNIELFSSFHTSLLPKEGFQWIPLNTLDATFTAFPEEVQSPKILLMVSNDFLHQIDESSENDCENCEAIKSEKNRLMVEMSKNLKEAKNNFDLLTAENEKNKLLVKKFSSLLSDCKKELDFYKFKFEEERKKCNEVSEKLKSLSICLENHPEKENPLQGKPQRTLSTSPASFDSNLATIASLLKSSHKKLPSQKPSLYLTGSQKTLKETDRALRRYLKETNRAGLIKKDSSNNFMFGNKKLLISLKQGNLLCRVGGGFENIEEFISKNDPELRPRSSSCLLKSHRRHLTIDCKKTDKSHLMTRTAMLDHMMKLRLRPQSTCFPVV
jgi:hypothetical protein